MVNYEIGKCDKLRLIETGKCGKLRWIEIGKFFKLRWTGIVITWKWNGK